MQIGAISGYQPYVYNTNAISSKSLNKISAIGNDPLVSKTDVSALISNESKNNDVLNPLKRGETLDFAGILNMQMQMSRMNADRIMKAPEPEQTEASSPEKANQAIAINNYQDSAAQAAQMTSMFDAAV